MVRLTLPHTQAISPELTTVEQSGLLRLIPGDKHLTELSFDGNVQGKSADLQPKLPLILHW